MMIHIGTVKITFEGHVRVDKRTGQHALPFHRRSLSSSDNTTVYLFSYEQSVPRSLSRLVYILRNDRFATFSGWGPRVWGLLP